jgi:Zn-dependent protease with chaperone function
MGPGTHRVEMSETFFDAQRRNRRATWRISFLSGVAALLMGVPLTLVLTPLAYAATLIVADIVNYFSPLPAEFWQNAQILGHLALRVGDFVFNHKPIDPQTLGFGLACLLLPGIIFTAILWTGVLALFRHGGVGGALSALNAREPNHGDLKELQVADVVAEMAIAAGLPSPRVMLMDSPGANAAVIGTCPDDARLVVSRHLLDRLNRDELQSVLGHLIASIGNGDLKIAFTVTSVFETCGLLVTLINSPFGPHARSTLWRIVRYGFTRSSGEAGRSAEAESVAALLTGDLDLDSDDISRFFDANQNSKSAFRKILNFVFFPVLFTNVAIQMTLWFFLSALLGPCMALLWRTRRYLADATAVQLTRNPDALASALEQLSGNDAAMPAGAWAAHLFIVNPKGDTSLGERQPTADEIGMGLRLWTQTAVLDNPTAGLVSAIGAEAASAPATPAEYADLRAEIKETQRAALRGDEKAIARLIAFGRAVSGEQGGRVPIRLPNPADIVAASKGDRAAIARLRSLTEGESEEPQRTRKSSGLQNESILSFHPSLKRRLKRLKRMGAHVDLKPADRKSVMVAVVLGLIFGPLLLLIAALMLVVIAMMIMLNLLFLTLWLAVIHGVFGWLGHA